MQTLPLILNIVPPREAFPQDQSLEAVEREFATVLWSKRTAHSPGQTATYDKS